MQKEYLCKDLSELPVIAQEIMKDFPKPRIWAFFGKMGAGKTTFIKTICNLLQVEDTVCSPTFAIVNEYFTSKRESVFHFDFYRLKNLAEAFDIGYEEYFYSGNYCFIEWSEKIEELLPEDYLRLDITVDELSGNRNITVAYQ